MPEDEGHRKEDVRPRRTREGEEEEKEVVEREEEEELIGEDAETANVAKETMIIKDKGEEMGSKDRKISSREKNRRKQILPRQRLGHREVLTPPAQFSASFLAASISAFISAAILFV